MPLSKVVDLATLEARLTRSPVERAGLVLANGIFDLLHVGHVRYLQAARAAGGRLLVALNSDESARRLKGEGRPLIPLAERLELVSSLGCVDWATWFEEDHVEEVLRRIRPEAHAKGSDYTVESVPERAVSKALGIRTIIAGDPKRHASSELIRRIREGRPDGG